LMMGEKCAIKYGKERGERRGERGEGRGEEMKKSPIIPYKTPEYSAWMKSGCLSFGDGGEVCDKVWKGEREIRGGERGKWERK
jgi:hypothetical protein